MTFKHNVEREREREKNTYVFRQMVESDCGPLIYVPFKLHNTR